MIETTSESIPALEVQGIALPVLDAVIESVRAVLGDLVPAVVVHLAPTPPTPRPPMPPPLARVRRHHTMIRKV
jgi:hypothetical protein